MPTLVTLIPNPAFKPDATTKTAWDAVQKRGAIDKVAYPTAVENIRQSGGMYAIKPTNEVTEAVKPRELEDMSSEELKLMMLSLGVKTEKQMKRAEVIKMIRIKLAEVDISDDA